MKSPCLSSLFGALLAFTTLPGGQAEEADKPFTSFEQIVDSLPHEIVADLRGSKQKEAALKANDLLLENMRNRPVSLDLKVEQAMAPVVTASKEHPMFRAQNTQFRKGAVPFVVVTTVGFVPEEAARVAKLKKGAKIHVEGKLIVASIFASSSTASLQVQISEAKLKE